jgi:hypothetical protein
MPNPPARLINRMSWEPAPSGDALLSELGTPKQVEAWQHYTDGIREFPYSDSVVRTPGPLQKGPGHPFFLSAEVANFGGWRAWQNDLGWTRPWGPAVARKYLQLVLSHWEKGLAIDPSPEALVIASSLRTTIHLAQWLEARNAKDWPELQRIALAERENVTEILPVLRANTQLGYASEGGGIIRGGLFNATQVEWKLGTLDDLLVRELPGKGVKPVLPDDLKGLVQ